VRYWKVLSILAVSLLGGKNVLADEVIQSVSHGTYELPLLAFAPPGSGQLGELVTCEDVAVPPFQLLLRISLTFDRFEGVCDDLGTTPCSGRLTAMQESCTLTGDGNTGQSGRIDAPYVKGLEMRICWDESAAGNCTSEYEVATGEGLGGQNQQLVGAPTAQGISVTETFKGSEFVVDGKEVKIRKATSINHRLFEVSGAVG
jgi:hypothetical protein